MAKKLWHFPGMSGSISLANSKLNMEWQGPSHYQILFESWVCSVGEKRLIKQMASPIQNHVNGLPMERYWKKRFGISNQATMENHWLGGFGESIQRIECSPSKNHTSGCLGHGENMKHWQFWLMLACPWCSKPIEDEPHIMQYLSDEATAVLGYYVKRFEGMVLREQHGSWSCWSHLMGVV